MPNYALDNADIVREAIEVNLSAVWPILSKPYDEFAAPYDQIFEDWGASIERQSMVLASILDCECGDR